MREKRNMAIGKKISLSQIIGLEGEDEVKLWLLKSCNIVATKVANDFGVDFIGQRRGALQELPTLGSCHPFPYLLLFVQQH